MNKKTLLFSALVASAMTMVYADIGQQLKEKAQEYKGYDELLENTTPLRYHNQTYYWIEYSRNFAYSGEVLLNESLDPVRDDWTLEVFSSAYVLHKSYPAASAGGWRDYAGFFSSIHGSFSRSENLSVPAADALEISRGLYDCAAYMENSIKSFDPDSAEKYLQTEAAVIKKMDAAQSDYAEALNAGFVQPGEYEDSLASIKSILIENQKNLHTAVEYLSGGRYARTTQQGEKQATETILIVLGVLLMIAVYYLRSKRSNSSRQEQPPRA